MFKDCLSSHGKSVMESISGDIAKKVSEDNVSVQLDPLVELVDDNEKGDVALKNLEGGDGAIGLAARPGRVGVEEVAGDARVPS